MELSSVQQSVRNLIQVRRFLLCSPRLINDSLDGSPILRRESKRATDQAMRKVMEAMELRKKAEANIQKVARMMETALANSLFDHCTTSCSFFLVR